MRADGGGDLMHAATPASRKVAEYILGNLRRWGWKAELETFEVLLPYPRRRHLEMLSPRRYVATTQEPAIDQDRDSGDANQLPTYNAYAGNGDVTAPLVYVNYGTPEDYQALQHDGRTRSKEDCDRRATGRSWPSIKREACPGNGAVGCLIHPHPVDDRYRKIIHYCPRAVRIVRPRACSGAV
ncbi:MAG: hypothetical protein U5J83_13065 [Bryobacterales bacterium]|nr:hypothetical protein [Bryobacterales bacterium]